MIPAAFTYVAPSSIAEAVAMLAQHEGARVLAGGHSLIPLMKQRRISPPTLIDIGGIAELRGIGQTDGMMCVGAMTTHAQIAASSDLLRIFPLMAEAVAEIGDPMVRHRGTFGGSLAQAEPGGDWPAAALALDARLRVIGPSGTRTISIDDFFVALMTTALGPGELLTQVDLPLPAKRSGMAYQKFAHPASGYALVGVAAIVTKDERGNCRSCRVAITGAGARAKRAGRTEMMMAGERLTPEQIAEAAAYADEELEILSDIYAGEDDRRHLVRVLTKRTLIAAAAASDVA